MFKKRWKWARDLSFCPTAAAIPLQSPRTVALTYGSCSPRLSLRTWRPTWLGAVGPPRAWPGVSEPPGRCSLRRPLSPAVSGARHVREGAGRARARLGEVRRVARETAGWEFWPPSIHAGLSTGPSEPGAFQPPRKPVIVDERRSQAEERRWGEPRWRGARVRGRGNMGARACGLPAQHPLFGSSRCLQSWSWDCLGPTGSAVLWLCVPHLIYTCFRSEFQLFSIKPPPCVEIKWSKLNVF
jgi:hypothetical protein